MHVHLLTSRQRVIAGLMLLLHACAHVALNTKGMVKTVRQLNHLANTV